MALESHGLTAAAVKSGTDVLLRNTGDKPCLIPRLLVLGRPGQGGSIVGYNLQLKNVGKETAYGIQVAVPWRDIVANGSHIDNDVSWWTIEKPWWVVSSATGLSIVSKLFKKLRLNGLATWFEYVKNKWLNLTNCSSMCITKDTGLILAPGEEIEMYFGATYLNKNTEENSIESGIYWKIGQLTTLWLFWHDSKPRRRWLPKLTTINTLKSYMKINFAIHCNKTIADKATSAFPKWEVASTQNNVKEQKDDSEKQSI